MLNFIKSKLTHLSPNRNRFRNRGCTFCGSSCTEQNLPLCAFCFAGLPWTTDYGHTLGELSAFYYEPPISQYILSGKTGKRLDKLQVLAELMAVNLPARINRPPEALIPVPLHNKRLRQRGFNQSLELARPLAVKLGIPLLTRGISRQRYTTEQKNLSASDRMQNMQGAFHIAHPLPYQHVAIIDDVVTTGTTCATLRQQLYRHGIKSVEIWCCATTKQ